MIARIHVNQSFIRANKKDNGNRPLYTVKRAGKTRYAREVIIDGPSKLVCTGEQLRCGAVAWLETEAELTLIDERSFKDAKIPQKKEV